MQYIVQVRPFPPPHHGANVLIHVSDNDVVDRLERWFRHNALDTKVRRLDDNDDVVDLAAANQLIMTLANLAAPKEAILRTAIQNGELMWRAARRAHASELRRAPSTPTDTTTIRQRASPFQPSSVTIAGMSTSTPRRVTFTPQQMG